MGKMFVFVRFWGNCNVDRMVKKLCDVWFDFHKLYASVPKDSSLHKIPSKIEKKMKFQLSHMQVWLEVKTRGIKNELMSLLYLIMGILLLKIESLHV